MRKENKNNYLIQQQLPFHVSFWHAFTRLSRHMRVVLLTQDRRSDIEPECTVPCLQAEEERNMLYIKQPTYTSEDFDRGWLAIVCPALLIWTRIYRWWIKRDWRSTSEWRLLHQHALTTDMEKNTLLNKVFIFVFFAHKKYSCSVITVQLNHWCYTDYFNDDLTIFLGLERGSCVEVYTGSEISNFIKNIIICVPKIN